MSHKHKQLCSMPNPIEESFGDNTCLYRDVMLIEPTSNEKFIKQVYLEIWREIRMEMNRANSRKEMKTLQVKLEALHGTYRILSNSITREMYDELASVTKYISSSKFKGIYLKSLLLAEQQDAEKQAQKAQKPPKPPKPPKLQKPEEVNSKKEKQNVVASPTSVAATIDDDADFSFNMNSDESKPPESMKVSPSYNMVTKSLLDESYDTYETNNTTFTGDTDGSLSLNTNDQSYLNFQLDTNNMFETQILNPILSCVPSIGVDKTKMKKKLAESLDEVKGTIHDVVKSVDQVFNAFTLTGDDIKNMCDAIGSEKTTFSCHSGIKDAVDTKRKNYQNKLHRHYEKYDDKKKGSRSSISKSSRKERVKKETLSSSRNGGRKSTYDDEN